MTDWYAYALYMRQLAADPEHQDELCRGCATCGNTRHDAVVCDVELEQPVEPTVSIKEAFALDDAVIQLDMRGSN